MYDLDININHSDLFLQNGKKENRNEFFECVLYSEMEETCHCNEKKLAQYSLIPLHSFECAH